MRTNGEPRAAQHRPSRLYRRKSKTLFAAGAVLASAIVPVFGPLARPALATGCDDYSTEVLASTPDVYWKLDESGGTTAADSSGNSNDATYGPGFRYGVEGIGEGSAIQTEGTQLFAGFLGFADATMFTTTASTFEAWIQSDGQVPSAAAPWVTLWANVGTVSVWLDRATNEILLADAFSRANSTPASTGYFLDDQPHHIAVTFDESLVGNNTILYVDGANEFSTTFAAYATTEVYVGSENGSSYQSFKGTIDEVAFYQRAITSTEVGLHVAAFNDTCNGTNIPSPGDCTYDAAILNDLPTAYWKLDDGTYITTDEETPYPDNNSFLYGENFRAVDYGRPGLIDDGGGSVELYAPWNNALLPNNIAVTPLPETFEGWFEGTPQDVPNANNASVLLGRDNQGITVHHNSLRGGTANTTYLVGTTSVALVEDDSLPLLSQVPLDLLDGEPHHVVLTRDYDDVLHAYVDGKHGGQVAGYTSDLGVAKYGYSWPGLMDNIAYYPRPLDAAAVETHYDAGVAQTGTCGTTNTGIHLPLYPKCISDDYTGEVLTDHPTGYYKFEELGFDRHFDTSGNDRDALVIDSNAPFLGATGLADGWSYGTGGYPGFGAAAPAAVLTGTTLSIEGWWQSGTTDGGIMFEKAGVISVGIGAGGLGVTDFVNARGIYAGVDVMDGRRHHIVVTVDAGVADGFKFYVDGLLVHTDTMDIVDLVTAPTRDDAPVTVGPGFLGGGLIGALDEVAFYTDVLPRARVLAHYEAAGDCGDPDTALVGATEEGLIRTVSDRFSSGGSTLTTAAPPTYESNRDCGFSARGCQMVCVSGVGLIPERGTHCGYGQGRSGTRGASPATN